MLLLFLIIGTFFLARFAAKEEFAKERIEYLNKISKLEMQLIEIKKLADESTALKEDLTYYRDLPYILSKKYLLFDSKVHQSLSELETPDIRNRLLRAFEERENYTLSFFNVYANVKHNEDSIRSYTVTLNDCTCPDYAFRGKPCKHMYMLALNFALLHCVDLRDVQEKLSSLFVQFNDLEQKIRREKEILKSNEQDLPWLAKMTAEYALACGNTDVTYLQQKHPPAPKASDTVKLYNFQNAELTLQNKKLEHQLAFYENCFPWLAIFKDLSVENALFVADLAETRGIIKGSEMLGLIAPYLPKDSWWLKQ